jgi:hypothetical protein
MVEEKLGGSRERDGGGEVERKGWWRRSGEKGMVEEKGTGCGLGCSGMLH